MRQHPGVVAKKPVAAAADVAIVVGDDEAIAMLQGELPCGSRGGTSSSVASATAGSSLRSSSIAMLSPVPSRDAVTVQAIDLDHAWTGRCVCEPRIDGVVFVNHAGGRKPPFENQPHELAVELRHTLDGVDGLADRIAR